MMMMVIMMMTTMRMMRWSRPAQDRPLRLAVSLRRIDQVPQEVFRSIASVVAVVVVVAVMIMMMMMFSSPSGARPTVKKIPSGVRSTVNTDPFQDSGRCTIPCQALAAGHHKLRLALGR